MRALKPYDAFFDDFLRIRPGGAVVQRSSVPIASRGLVSGREMKAASSTLTLDGVNSYM